MDTIYNANSNIPAMIELARIEGELLTIKSRVKLDLDMPDEDNFKQYHYDIMHLAEDYGYRFGKGDFESPKCNELVNSIKTLAKEMETTDIGNLWDLSYQSAIDNGYENREGLRTIYLVNSSVSDDKDGGTLFSDIDKACDLYRDALKFTAFGEVHQGQNSGDSVLIYSKEVPVSEVENIIKKSQSIPQGKILDDSFNDITHTIHIVDSGLSPDDKTLTYRYWLDYAKNETNNNNLDMHFEEGNNSSYYESDTNHENEDDINQGFALLKNLSGSLQAINKNETGEHKDMVLWSPGKPWAEDNLVYKHSIGEYVSDSSGRTMPEILDDQPELMPLDKEKFLQWYEDRGAAEYQKPGIILTPQQSEMIKSDVESFCLPASESSKSQRISNQNRATRMR
jgi:hypothetical protein